MRVVAIIQARLSSKRLPNKVLADLCGKPMLWHIIERVKRARLVDEVTVAVSSNEQDIEIQNIIPSGIVMAVPKVDENDLIGRFYSVACDSWADLIVRICADNPFVDPVEIDRAVDYYMDVPRVYVSNMHQHHESCMISSGKNGYPDGIGCEVFSMSRLKWMHKTIKDAYQREHPHYFFHAASEISSPQCPSEISRPDLRLDINTQDDLDYVRSIYEIVYPKNPQFTTKEVIEAIDAHHLERCPIPT